MRLLKRILPWVFFVLMGIGAFVYTVLPGSIHATSKALLIAFICLLGAGEIAILYRTNRQQTEEFQQERNRAQQRFEMTITQFERMQQVSEQSSEERRKAESVHQTALLGLIRLMNDPTPTLKRRALELAGAISDFVSERLQNAPKQRFVFSLYPESIRQNTQFQSDYQRESEAYVNESVDIYRQKFIPKMERIVKELASHGLVDEDLTNLQWLPHSHASITEIADRLAALGEANTIKNGVME